MKRNFVACLITFATERRGGEALAALAALVACSRPAPHPDTSSAVSGPDASVVAPLALESLSVTAHCGGGSAGDARGRQLGHVTPRKLEVLGAGLPTDAVDKILRMNLGRFRLCYEARSPEHCDTSGLVRVRFAIGRAGTVASSSDDGSTLADAGVVRCIVRGFDNLSFPQPEPAPVEVLYAMDLAPGE